MHATILLSSLFILFAAGAPLALPQDAPRCKSQLNYLLCLETCVLPKTVECPDRCSVIACTGIIGL